MRMQTWLISGLSLLVGCSSTPLGGAPAASASKASAQAAPSQWLGGLA